MIPEQRNKYNSGFTEEKYSRFLKDFELAYGHAVGFRIAETPLFLPKDFTGEVMKASEEIISFLVSGEYKEHSANAIPPGMEVPGEVPYTAFLALDFAVCKNEDGSFMPQLIELQGFPSLYCYQELLGMNYKKHFPVPENFTNLFSGLSHDSYIKALRDVIVGSSDPENVILLEIEPENQKTKIDFSCTEDWLGVKPVCISDVFKDGRKLYYKKNGHRVPVERIYNRVIFDELKNRNDISYSFSFRDDLDVAWVPHPNWFFRISKYTLPFLKSKYVPETFFLGNAENYPGDLGNYILKPLFSFAGSGVRYDITRDELDRIEDRDNYILQRKISYEPAVKTPDLPAKAELRIMFIHTGKKLIPVTNIVRLSKGKMMGVDYNKDKTWVGSSIAFFDPNP